MTSYKKMYLVDGDVLKAAHIDHLEEGILAIEQSGYINKDVNDLTNYYPKDYIDEVLGAYIDEVASLIGGVK